MYLFTLSPSEYFFLTLWIIKSWTFTITIHCPLTQQPVYLWVSTRRADKKPELLILLFINLLFSANSNCCTVIENQCWTVDKENSIVNMQHCGQYKKIFSPLNS